MNQDHHLPEPIEQAIERIEDATAEARVLAPLVEEAERRSHWDLFRRFWPLLVVAALAITIVASGALNELSLANLERHHGEVAQFASQHPIWTRLALWAAIVILIITGLPGSPILTLAGGLLFGIVEGAAISVLGDTSGALILYALTRRSLRGNPSASPNALIGRLKSGFDAHPSSYALFLRLVPLFPFTAVSIALAWLNCRPRTFLWTTAVGLLPTAIVYAAIGDGFESALKQHQRLSLDLLGEPRFLLPLIAIGVLALVPVLLGWRKRKS